MKSLGQKLRRQTKIRSKLKGTSDRPRISVFRSNRHLFAQIINDEKHQTVISVSERSLKEATGSKTEKAKKLGVLLASLAKSTPSFFAFSVLEPVASLRLLSETEITV